LSSEPGYLILKLMVEQSEIRALIFKRLTESMLPEKIVYEISRKTGMYWSDAQKLVAEGQAESSNQIARRQSPLVMALSLLTFAAGLVLVFICIAGFFVIAKGTTYTIFGVLNSANFLLYIINFAPVLLFIGLLGMGMVVGSANGIRKMFSAFLD
jgi:hypothetical protein